MSELVKWFMYNPSDLSVHMTGAPVCSGTAGTRLAIFDACLRTGFNIVSVSGLSRSGTTATATASSAFGFVVDQVIKVTGAVQSEWNGEYRVSSTPQSTEITFSVPETHTQNPTGTIQIRAAPVGSWDTLWSQDNIAAIRSLDVTGTQLYLRVDDSAATYARVRGYEVMTARDSGTGPFPTLEQIGGSGWYQYGSNVADAAARRWFLAGDSKMFVFGSEWYPSSYLNRSDLLFFGDIISWKPADAFHCIINAAYAAQGWPGHTNSMGIPNSTNSRVLARSYSQLSNENSIPFRLYGAAESPAALGGEGYNNNLMGFLTVHYGRLRVAESSSIGRGELPGVRCPLHVRPFGHFQKFETTDKKFVSVSTYSGQFLIQINGAWR